MDDISKRAEEAAKASGYTSDNQHAYLDGWFAGYEAAKKTDLKDLADFLKENNIDALRES